MKFTVTMKHPDAVNNAIEDLVAKGVPDAESKVYEATRPWMRYGEYIDVEFHTDGRPPRVLEAK